MAQWITEQNCGFPIERAMLGSCALALMHIAGAWCWPVQRDGHDMAEGVASVAEDARLQAEAAARKLG
jgi:hypothetical protein